MKVKTNGIFLKSQKYTEDKLICTVFTHDFGKISFLVQGVGSVRKKAITALFQPLFLLNFEVNYKPSRDLQSIGAVSPLFIYTSIPYNIAKSTVILFLAEILFKILHDNEKNDALYLFTETSLRYFDAIESDYQNFHLQFLLQLLKYTGFYPENNFSDISTWFDMQKGRFTQEKPAHKNYIDYPHSYYFQQFLNDGFSYSSTVQVNGNTRNALLHKIVDYYFLHYGQLTEIKSLLVLQSVFHN